MMSLGLIAHCVKMNIFAVFTGTNLEAATLPPTVDVPHASIFEGAMLQAELALLGPPGSPPPIASFAIGQRVEDLATEPIAEQQVLDDSRATKVQESVDRALDEQAPLFLWYSATPWMAPDFYEPRPIQTPIITDTVQTNWPTEPGPDLRFAPGRSPVPSIDLPSEGNFTLEVLGSVVRQTNPEKLDAGLLTSLRPVQLQVTTTPPVRIVHELPAQLKLSDQPISNSASTPRNLITEPEVQVQQLGPGASLPESTPRVAPPLPIETFVRKIGETDAPAPKAKGMNEPERASTVAPSIQAHPSEEAAFDTVSLVPPNPRPLEESEHAVRNDRVTLLAEETVVKTAEQPKEIKSVAAKSDTEQEGVEVADVIGKQVAPGAPLEPQVSAKVDLAPKVRDALLSQAKEAIERLVESRPFGRVKILLQPEELGFITVTVRTMAGKIEADVTASNDSVRTALEAAKPALAPTMESKGLQLTSLTIQGQGLADRQDSAFRQSQTPTQQEFQRMVGERLTREGASQPEERRYNPIWSDQIDLRI